MNSERMFKVIGEIDGDLIEGLATCVSPPKNICSIKRISVLAACAFLVVGMGLLVMQHSELFGDNAILTSSTPSGKGYSGSAGLSSSIANSKAASDGASSNSENVTSSSRFPSELTPSANLPTLTLPQNPLAGGGMGCEGYYAYNISDLKNANPWSAEENIQVLPVFKRAKEIDGTGYTFDADTGTMKKLLIETGKNFGLYIDDSDINTQTDSIHQVNGSRVVVSYVWVKQGNTKLMVNAQLAAEAEFSPSLSLPKGDRLALEAPYSVLQQTALDFEKEHRLWLGMLNPKTDIHGGDYTSDAKQQLYNTRVFDDSGSIIDKIMNYNFNYAEPIGDENGNLGGVRIHTPDLSNIIGNYPIISLDQAQQLLAAGKCIANGPSEKFPGNQYVKKGELIYRADSLDNIFIPYYRFYVEDPSQKQANGLKSYGAFYVPAVEQKYIANMPIHFSVGN